MATRGNSSERWLVGGVPRRLTAGGSLRAAHVFAALVERTDAAQMAAFGRRGVPLLAAAIAARSRGWRRSLSVASTQLVPPAGLSLFRGPVRPRVLDLHDHPGRQALAFGVPIDAGHSRALEQLVDRNVDRFAKIVVPSASFGSLCAIGPDRSLVIPNGTDTERVVPGPESGRPDVAMLSGAAAGRGIEQLVEAMARVRPRFGDARLRLALSGTSRHSAAYVRDITSELARPWLSIEAVPYARIGTFMAGAAVLVIPHPANEYMDVATPVKLFDSMAAGRAVVVTPRRETAAIVTACEAGIVAGSDHVDDLAAAIERLLADDDLRRRLGENGRRCAVARYDWKLLSTRLADEVLGHAQTDGSW
ncbi:MAG: hypothetical protein DLM71_09745 [Chloroflexi bacterium]|nr:MAG: hypothetical protein DLM71_09745 [Chloroflexota bacterium]